MNRHRDASHPEPTDPMRIDKSGHLFRILDEVSKDGTVTQRHLSQRLGVALGLTNLYFRRLVMKGWIKVTNVKANRLRYELTPAGIAQKTRMAFQYIEDSYVFYREARKSLTSSFGRLKAGGAHSVVLYGSGELAEIALLSLQEVGLDLAGIVSARGAGESLCGWPVRQPESLRSLAYDQVVVIDPDRAQLETTLARCGVDASNVFWVEL